MVKFNGIPLPELVKDFDKVKPKVFVQRIIPKKKVAYRRVVGDYGYEIVVRGLIESNLPTRDEIDEALQNAVEILEGFADGESHELDLEDHSDLLFCLAIDPRFSRMAYNKISYEITFMQSSLVQFGILQDSVSIADVLSGVPGKVGLLEDFVGVSENIKHYKGVGGTEYGFGTVGSQSYPTTNFGETTDVGGDTNWSGYIVSLKGTLAVAGTLKSISLRIEAATNARVSIFSHDAVNNKPNALLAESASEACSAGEWHVFTMTAVYLAAGTYWLALQHQSAVAAIPYVVATGRISQRTQAYGAFPATWPADSVQTDSRNISIYATYVQIKGYLKRGSKFTLPSQKEIYYVKFYSHVAVGNARVAIFDEASPKVKKWESGSIALAAGANIVLISSGTPNSLTLPAADYGVWWQYDDVGDAPSYTAGAAGDGRYLAQAYGAFPSTISGDTSTAEKWTETLAELGWEEIV